MYHGGTGWGQRAITMSSALNQSIHFFFFFQKHKHQKFTYTPPVYPYSWILHIPNTHLLQMKQMNKELSSFHIQTSDCLCPFCPCVPFIQWSKAIFVLIWFYLYKLWRNAYYHLWLFFPDPLLKEISLYSWSLHRAEISRPLNKELSSFWWWWFSCWVKSDYTWDFPSKNTGVGCHFPHQGIFPTQGLNPCLLQW